MKSATAASLAGKAVTGCLVACLCCAAPVRADILPVMGTPTISPSGTGTYYWTYETFVTDSQKVETGNYFTIYDFEGLVGSPSGPSGYVSSVSYLDTPVVTPLGLIFPIDNPLYPNVTFTYSGPTIVGGPVSLGLFTLESPIGLRSTYRTFVGSGTSQNTGTVNANITRVLVPEAPEPGAYAFGLITAGSLFALIKRKRHAVKDGK